LLSSLQFSYKDPPAPCDINSERLANVDTVCLLFIKKKIIASHFMLAHNIKEILRIKNSMYFVLMF